MRIENINEVPILIHTMDAYSTYWDTWYHLFKKYTTNHGPIYFLTEEKVPYEVGQASFRHLARAQITGDTVGELKILFHRDTLEVLGIHCFGNNAAEIIHIGQVVMHSPNNTLKYFVETTFNYPTMAEAYRVAALNGMNRLF